ncbi:hypothetical protein [Citrobacter freundii]|uniref:hypothetical protein n=1 Tax=Citrobacter freundii TaxID=546 RepID=UPI003C6EF0E8
MEQPNSLAVQLGAFDTMLRAILHVVGDDQLNGIKNELERTWDYLEKNNQKPAAASQFKASREMAIGMIEHELQVRSAK